MGIQLIAKEDLSNHIGQSGEPSDWFEMDQERINTFAECTEDRQFIHIDPVKAAEFSPYKVTIAHGFQLKH